MHVRHIGAGSSRDIRAAAITNPEAPSAQTLMILRHDRIYTASERPPEASTLALRTKGHLMQQLTVLVKHSDLRYVALCDDGGIALVWQRAVIHLRPDELERAVRLLDQWAHDLASDWASDDLITVSRDATGTVQLWLGGVGLYLSGWDVVTLCDLLQIAVLRLHHAEALHTRAAHSGTEALCHLRLPLHGTQWNN